jgi:hypothetical protein
MGFEDEVEQFLRRPCQQTDTGGRFWRRSALRGHSHRLHRTEIGDIVRRYFLGSSMKRAAPPANSVDCQRLPRTKLIMALAAPQQTRSLTDCRTEERGLKRP